MLNNYSHNSSNSNNTKFHHVLDIGTNIDNFGTTLHYDHSNGSVNSINSINISSSINGINNIGSIPAEPRIMHFNLVL